MKKRCKKLTLTKETLLMLGSMKTVWGGNDGVTAKTCNVPCDEYIEPSVGTVCTACSCLPPC
jgi:hypothetical protein